MALSKLLLIRLSSAGDVLLTSPLLRVIKQSKPDTKIHFVVKAQYLDLIQYNPNIDAVHLVQENSDLYQLESLRRELLRQEFDTTLDLHNNFRSVYLRRGTSKEIRVINKELLKRLLLVKTKMNFFSCVRPTALKYAQVYDSALTDVPQPEIFFDDQVKRMRSIWESISTVAARSAFLCPGARHFTKRWPVDYWIDLSRKLGEKVQVVLIGGDADVESCRKIQRETTCLNFCGRFSLLESAAMLSFADVVVTNDSFLMHAANAVGKKIVAIFGSAVREFGFFPYKVEHRVMEVDGLNCRPCSHIGRESCPKGHFKCMAETKPEAVYRATMELLG